MKPTYWEMEKLKTPKIDWAMINGWPIRVYGIDARETRTSDSSDGEIYPYIPRFYQPIGE